MMGDVWPRAAPHTRHHEGAFVLNWRDWNWNKLKGTGGASGLTRVFLDSHDPSSSVVQPPLTRAPTGGFRVIKSSISFLPVKRIPGKTLRNFVSGLAEIESTLL